MRVLASTPSLLAAAAEPLLLCAWTGAVPVAADVRRIAGALVTSGRTMGPAGLVVLVPHGLPLPSEEVRDVVTVEMKKLLPFIAVGATVIAEDGLRGVAMRAVTSTLQLVSRAAHPERVFASIPEAATFLHAELKRRGPVPSAAVLEASIAALSARVATA